MQRSTMAVQIVIKIVPKADTGTYGAPFVKKMI